MKEIIFLIVLIFLIAGCQGVGKAFGAYGCEPWYREFRVKEGINHSVDNFSEAYDFILNVPLIESHLDKPFRDVGETAEKGGSHNELTLLFSSLLRDIDVRHFLLFEGEEAFVLVCGEEAVYEPRERSYKIVLEPGEVFYYGGLGEEMEPREIKYSFKADGGVDYYVVPEHEDFKEAVYLTPFDFYARCFGRDVKEADVACKMEQSGGLLLVNHKKEPRSINLTVERNEFKGEPFYYLVFDEECFLVDVSLRGFSYPGHDLRVDGGGAVYDMENEKCVSLG